MLEIFSLRILIVFRRDFESLHLLCNILMHLLMHFCSRSSENFQDFNGLTQGYLNNLINLSNLGLTNAISFISKKHTQ